MTAPAKAPAIPPLFRAALKAAGLPMPEMELQFHPTRKWRFDYGWWSYWSTPDGTIRRPAVALEVQGGLFVNGRHSRGAALLKEHEKLSEAAALGWRILFCTPQNLCSAENIDRIKRALEA